MYQYTMAYCDENALFSVLIKRFHFAQSDEMLLLHSALNSNSSMP